MTVTAALVSQVTKLLSHDNREVRTAIAALLSNHSISAQDAQSIEDDPTAQYLVRATSGKALVHSAQNGSFTAIGHLARNHDYDSLRILLMDPQTQESVRKATANSLASLGKQEANALLEEANSKFEGSFSKALSRGAKRQKRNEAFASRKKH